MRRRSTGANASVLGEQAESNGCTQVRQYLLKPAREVYPQYNTELALKKTSAMAKPQIVGRLRDIAYVRNAARA